MKKKNTVLLIYFLTLAGIAVWVGIVFLAPYLKSRSSSLNVFLYAIFSPVCHQIPSRSFICFGYPLAVCARCLGIYSGFLAGTALYPILNDFSSLSLPKTRTFILVSIPIGIDTLGNFLRLWATHDWIRFALGFLWGAILPLYFIFGLTDFVLRSTRAK